MDFLEALRPSSGSRGVPFDPRGRIFPAALQAYDDPTRHRAWRASRGAAKSTTGEYVLLASALQIPRCAVIYMSDTADRAKMMVWGELVEWAAPLGGTPLGDVIYFPNGSRLFVTGADSIKLFDRKKGIKRIYVVFLDECQDWKSEVLKYAVTRVFMTRLGDLEKSHGVKGRILMAGFGGRDTGYWHDVCTDPELGFGVTRWTAWDNPHIADPDGEFAATCKAAKAEIVTLKEPVFSHPGSRPRWLDTPDPGMRREFFAEFNSGGKLQIFPVALARLIKRERCSPPATCAWWSAPTSAPSTPVRAVCWLFTQYDPLPYLVAGEEGVRAVRQPADPFRPEFAAECVAEIQADRQALHRRRRWGPG